MPPPVLALIPSLVDRLTDPDAGGPGLRYGYTPEQMMDAVRDDLEDLLNTRAPWPDLDVGEFPETAASVLRYGLPDVTSLPAANDSDRESLGRVLEVAIACHEPRLKGVRVGVIDDEAGDGTRQVKFQIDARLAVDPAPEVGFVTVLSLFTGQASVAPRDG